ncbi:MAG: hypothetical protein ACMG6E_05260, partial [Candidatus Roizmanbacteria bacterium]
KGNEDPTRPLKTVATDLVVNEFFKSGETLHHFMTYVYNLFNDAIIIYRRRRGLKPLQMFFLYKGGNILRIISKEFQLELPESTTRQIHEFYAPFFKRGDADFTIYLDPEIDDYDEVYREAALMSFLLQEKIRAWFDDHLMEYFDFFRYNSTYQSHIMQEYLQQFNDALKGTEAPSEDSFVNFRVGSAIADPNLPAGSFGYDNNPDTTLRFADPNGDWQADVRKAHIAVIGKKDSIMTITHNDALDFQGGSIDVRVKFNLTRTKIIFTLQRQSGELMRVGGELIDVSISHRDDSYIQHFFDTLEDNVTVYTMARDADILTFNSYRLSYLTEDLENILFLQRERPWIDRKYAKRINRLYYLYFVDIFIRVNGANERVEVLRNARQFIFALLAEINADNFNATITKARNNIKRFNKKYRELEPFILKFMNHLYNLLEQLGSDELDELQSMSEILVTNSDLVIEAVKSIKDQCLTDLRVQTDVLENTEINNLL